MSKKIFLLFFFVFAFSVKTAAADELKLLRVTPSGEEVTERSQIVFQFDRPMTELGNMDRTAEEVPVKITPDVNCRWRWLNTTALACQLGGADLLKQSERYEINVRPGFKSLDGSKMKKSVRYVIETRRPEVRVNESTFVGRSLSPQRPIWRVRFGIAPKRDGLADYFYFRANGREIPAVIVPQDYPRELSYTIAPSQDLGVGVPYTVLYREGISPLQGGSLKSRRSGILGKGETVPVFQVLGLKCWDNQYNSVEYSMEELKKIKPLCRFDRDINIRLSDEAGMDKISSLVEIRPEGKVLDGSFPRDTINLPRLKAGTDYTVVVSGTLTDVWGAALGREVSLSFRTSDRDPNLENPYSYAVLEALEKTDLVDYAANLDSAEIIYNGFNSIGPVSGVRPVEGIRPDLRNVQYAFEVGVRGMLEDKTGFLKGRFRTDPKTYEQTFFVSVTPWEVLVKLGRYSSVAWVVDMATGAPVEGAKVELYKDVPAAAQADPGKVFAKAETGKDGAVRLPGYAEFDPAGEMLNSWKDSVPSFFVKVSKSGSVGVMPLKNAFQVSAGQLSDWNVDTAYSLSPDMYVKSWGITAQGVYRPGDVVRYKLYVREESEKTYGKAPEGTYALTVIDPTDKNVLDLKDLKLSEFGALDGEFKLPESSTAGWYRFVLKYKDRELSPMRFLVSDFVPSPFKVATEIGAKTFEAGEEATVDTYATLFSGGPYADAPVRQSIVLSYAPFVYRGKGLENKSFNFDQPLEMGEYSDEILLNKSSNLNAKGEFRNTVVLGNSPKPYGRLRLESTVSDDSGRSTSGAVSADYFSVDRLVGLRKNEWMSTVGKPSVFEYVVTNPASELVPDVAVNISFFLVRYKAVREKSSGNAFITRYDREEVSVGECLGVSGTAPKECSFTPKESGPYFAVASITDTKGRRHFVREHFYVNGKDYVAWETKDNRIDLTLDKKEYRPGDTIRMFIKNPMPGASALITVERYGVLESFVKTFDSSTAAVEIPVTEDFFPGVYVSVTIFSRRVEKPVEGTVDLGKPAEWGGYVKIPVTDASRKIDVSVAAEKPVYRPRQKAKIDIQASLPAKGKGPLEAAVVVLDEAVLALLPGGTTAYDPYKGFYALGALDVRTYSMIERLIGRQKVEKKGANQGGDGGSNFTLRDVFKFVGYWNPSLKLDGNGRGSFEMELPDNLTGWRVIVMAVNETDRMGMGETRFKVNKPLEIRPLLPNQVRTTDIFMPAVSILNRSPAEQNVTLTMSASGKLAEPAEETKTVVLKPFERRGVFFESVRAALNPETREGEITLKFTARAGEETDGLIQKVPVRNLTTMQTAAEYGSSTEESVSVPLSVPQNVDVYGGSLVLSVSPTALGGLDKVVAWMKDYPYSCWEQQIGRALVAASYVRVRDSLSDGDLWPDAEEFVRATLEKASNYQAPNGGMAYFEAKNDYVSPYLSAYTGFAFVQLKRMGYEIPENVAAGLQNYLYRVFRETDPKISREVLMTTRLMSLPFLSSRQPGLIVSCDFDAFERELPLMSVFDKALFLSAARSVPDRKDLAARIEMSLLSMMNSTSGRVLFQDGDTGPWWYALLSSPARDNCAVLTALTAGGTAGNNTDLVEKLFRSVSSLRRGDGTWGNTQANTFCMNAAESYARAFESEAVDMTVTGRADGTEILNAGFKAKSDAPVTEKVVLGKAEAGRKMTASFRKEGTGRYYYKTILSYPAMDGREILSGMEVRRSYEVERYGRFQPVREGMSLKRGELVRVSLDVMNPAPRTFVALMDPVPGGLEPVNRNLATASSFDADKAGDELGTFLSGFYFREIGHDSVKFYAETLNRGEFKLSYTAQVVADGTFKAFPAKIEAMYEPDIFGLSALQTLSVETVAKPSAVPPPADEIVPAPETTGAESDAATVFPAPVMEPDVAAAETPAPAVPKESFFQKLKRKIRAWTHQKTPDMAEEEETDPTIVPPAVEDAARKGTDLSATIPPALPKAI